MKTLFLAIALLFLNLPAHAAVWTPTQTWTPAWERSYQEWVKTEWTKDYFQKNGPYKGLILDCADAVYAMRFIYAAANKLPFAVRDPSGGRTPISQAATRFDQYPESQRPVYFLKYLAGILSTQSLVGDSYPLATNREAIRSGVFLRTDQKSHHSWTVKDVSRTGIPYLIFATRPASSRLYERREFPSMQFLFDNNIKAERAAGFRGFRLPEQLSLPEWQVPGFSLEQYQIPLAKWKDTMNARLRLAQETPAEHVERILSDACQGAQERILFVNEGLRAQAKAAREGRQCLNAVEYDDTSTPSRDGRLRDSFVELDQAIKVVVDNRIALDPVIQERVNQILMKGRSGSLGSSGYCAVEYTSGRWLTLGQISELSVLRKLSPNPNETIENRWGQGRAPSQRAAQCPTY